MSASGVVAVVVVGTAVVAGLGIVVLEVVLGSFAPVSVVVGLVAVPMAEQQE